MRNELNKILSSSFLRFEFDFYEDFWDFDYFEISNEESPLSVINCIICKEPLYLTLPKSDTNKEILEKIINFLKDKKVDQKEIERIEKLKTLPICRWDLFKILGDILENYKDLKGFFEKLSFFYEFENLRKEKRI
ncbi:MAG: hypothetical protein QXV63_00810 [Candidatus Aenigmatarchaeota archaeon]|nr:hypothetical protein [Candidatus Aenigmarchaeota archaeon]